MRFDLRAVHSFVTLSTTLSFTKAAAALEVAQPQLSVRIRSLEGQLGFRLFERSSRHVRLTTQGERLLPYARRLLDAADQLGREAEDIRFGIVNTLRVGAVEYFQPLRRRLLSRYMKQHPAVAVEVVSLGISEAISALAAGRLDVAFVFHIYGQPAPAELEHLILLRHPVGLLLPGKSPLSRKAWLEPADLDGLSVALFRRDMMPVLHDEIAAVLSRLGARIVRLPEPSESGLVDFVRETGAAAACARWWTSAEDQPAGVVHRSIRDVSFDLSCMLVRPHSPASPECDRFWRMAQRSVGSQAMGHEEIGT
jgi:DNA-binding transcriptional LysR family regulator